jgi:hypothetical protein
MNTLEVAEKWKQMCLEGKNLECINELYADNVVSKEMPGVPYGEIVSGKQNVLEKSQQWLNDVVEFHSNEISEPLIAGNHFSSKMNFDVTFKSRGRQQMEEVCVFKVEDGKIANKQFFYSL